MTIKDAGEFGFIKSLKNILSGIGDDCAVLPYKDDDVLLVTTDALVENIHFLLDKVSPYDLGYKAMAVNLSDIAAMGGSPMAAVISLSMPSSTPLLWLQEFYQGLQGICKIYDITIVGGDTTGSPGPLYINVTLLGTMPKGFVKKRSTAKVGDVVCTTDFCGDSGAGLKALIEDIRSPLVAKHYRPRPHLAEGAFLSRLSGVHAMMDLSDGIASDSMRIAEESLCEIQIDSSSLPLSPEFLEITAKHHWDRTDLALTGGEDYCLLVTIDPHTFEEINKSFRKAFNRSLYPIGRVVSAGEAKVSYTGGPMNMRGFTHFA